MANWTIQNLPQPHPSLQDTYESELYGFVCRETELVNLLRMFYQYQAEYHQQVAAIMQALLPSLSDAFGKWMSAHARVALSNVHSTSIASHMPFGVSEI